MSTIRDVRERNKDVPAILYQHFSVYDHQGNVAVADQRIARSVLSVIEQMQGRHV